MKKPNRRQKDTWGSVDWSMSNVRIAGLTGFDPTHVGRMRLLFAPERYRRYSFAKKFNEAEFKEAVLLCDGNAERIAEKLKCSLPTAYRHLAILRATQSQSITP